MRNVTLILLVILVLGLLGCAKSPPPYGVSVDGQLLGDSVAFVRGTGGNGIAGTCDANPGSVVRVNPGTPILSINPAGDVAGMFGSPVLDIFPAEGASCSLSFKGTAQFGTASNPVEVAQFILHLPGHGRAGIRDEAKSNFSQDYYWLIEW